MAPRSLGAALLLCSITISHAAAEPRWSRIDTPHFVVIGTGSEKHLQTVGAQFEGFREALTRLLSPTATATAVPTRASQWRCVSQIVWRGFRRKASATSSSSRITPA